MSRVSALAGLTVGPSPARMQQNHILDGNIVVYNIQNWVNTDGTAMLDGTEIVRNHNGTGGELKGLSQTYTAAFEAGLREALSGGNSWSVTFKDVLNLNFFYDNGSTDADSFITGHAADDPDGHKTFTSKTLQPGTMSVDGEFFAGLATFPNYSTYGNTWFSAPDDIYLMDRGHRLFLHEYGHIFGLHHPTESHAEGAFDTQQYTIMSYNDHLEEGGNVIDGASTIPYGLQLWDIEALHALYPELINSSTRSSATVYKWGSGEAFGPQENYLYTIWDGGGDDTISAEGTFTVNGTNVSGSVIDLHDSSFSSIGSGVLGLHPREISNNVAIAEGSAIENAIGSSYNDTIHGNLLSNVLRGGGGDDTIDGGGGDESDTIYGDDLYDSRIVTVSESGSLNNGSSSLSVDVSLSLPEVATGTAEVSGFISGSGEAASHLNIAFVIDVSGSMDSDFDNGLTRLEAAKEALLALLKKLNDTGLGDRATIKIIPFSEVAHDNIVKDFAGADKNSNGQLDLYESFKDWGAEFGTNYEVAINAALSFFSSSESGSNLTFFISDGEPNLGDWTSHYQALKQVSTVQAIAIGDQLGVLQSIDSDGAILSPKIPNELVDAVTKSSVALSDVASVDILRNGVRVASITATGTTTYADDGTVVGVPDSNNKLTATPLGIHYSFNVTGLTHSALPDNGSQATNDIEAVVHFTGSSGTVSVEGTIEDTSAGNDTLTGGDGADHIFGGAGNDTLIGGGSADELVGGLGDDIYFADASDTIVELIGGGRDTVYVASGLSYALPENVEVLAGISGTPRLAANSLQASVASIPLWQGNEGDNLFIGDNGDSVMEGRGGNDTFQGRGGADTIKGGYGSDTVDYSTSQAGVSVDLVQQVVSGGDADGDTIDSIENAIGSDFADVFVASVGIVNRIDGGAGNDQFFGKGDGDILIGGAGNDSIDYSGSIATSPSGMGIYAVATGTMLPSFAVGDTIGSIETIVGSAFSDYIQGGAENNFISGGNGNDILAGGLGYDTLNGQAGADTYAGTLAELNFDTVYLEAGDRLNVRGVNLSTANLTISWLSASIDADLNGTTDAYLKLAYSLSTDFISRPWYDGTLFVANNGDTVQMLDSSTKYNFPVDNYQRIDLGVGNDTILSTDGNFYQVLGGDGDDYFHPTGYWGGTFRGGRGNDVFDARDSQNQAVYDELEDSNGYTDVGVRGIDADLVTGRVIDRFGDIDTVLGVDWFYLSNKDDRLVGTDEREFVVGYNGNDTLLGMGGADDLRGEEGDDYLDGGDGDDNIQGGSGNNILIGGNGRDTVSFLNAQSGVTVDLAAGTAINGFGGTDRLEGFENITGSISAYDILSGNESNNYIVGWDGGGRLYGRAGNDQLSGGSGDDWFEGGVGDDLITSSGVGKDTYYLARGDQADRISSYSNPAPLDSRVLFGSDVSHEQLWFQRQGNDLKATVIGTGDSMTVLSWYASDSSKIDWFEAGDGKKLMATDVEAMVQAMASYSAPSLGQTDLPTATHNQLQSAFDTYWA